MIRYTLIFVFNQKLDEVVLIKKNRPNWQAGKLNGVGGRLIKNEDPAACAEREVLEEAGLDVHVHQFLTYYGRKYETYQMHVFWAMANLRMTLPETKTDEKVGTFSLDRSADEYSESDFVPGAHEFMLLALQAAKNCDRL